MTVRPEVSIKAQGNLGDLRAMGFRAQVALSSGFGSVVVRFSGQPQAEHRAAGDTDRR